MYRTTQIIINTNTHPLRMYIYILYILYVCVDIHRTDQFTWSVDTCCYTRTHPHTHSQYNFFLCIDLQLIARGAWINDYRCLTESRQHIVVLRDEALPSGLLPLCMELKILHKESTKISQSSYVFKKIFISWCRPILLYSSYNLQRNIINSTK